MSEIKIIGSVYDPIRVTATVAAAVVGAPGMVWRGTYNAARYYYENEVVYWNGSSWIANRYVEEGLVPGVSASWSLVAQSGTSVPWADPEVYVPGNLLQVNAGSDGFEDSGVPAADVAILPTFMGNDDIVILDDDGKLKDSLVSIQSVMTILNGFTTDDIPIYTNNGQLAASGKTIDNVKTELGYLYIPASAFEARKTNGAAWAVEESATYDQVRGCWLFDAATPEAIQIIIPNYGSGSLITSSFKYRIHAKLLMISVDPGSDNSVSWYCKASTEKATADTAWGDPVYINDAYAVNSIEVSDWSELVMPQTDADLTNRIIIEIGRYANDTEYDTLAQDIALFGVEFQFNVTR